MTWTALPVSQCLSGLNSFPLTSLLVLAWVHVGDGRPLRRRSPPASSSLTRCKAFIRCAWSFGFTKPSRRCWRLCQTGRPHPTEQPAQAVQRHFSDDARREKGLRRLHHVADLAQHQRHALVVGRAHGYVLRTLPWSGQDPIKARVSVRFQRPVPAEAQRPCPWDSWVQGRAGSATCLKVVGYYALHGRTARAPLALRLCVLEVLACDVASATVNRRGVSHSTLPHDGLVGGSDKSGPSNITVSASVKRVSHGQLRLPRHMPPDRCSPRQACNVAGKGRPDTSRTPMHVLQHEGRESSSTCCELEREVDLSGDVLLRIAAEVAQGRCGQTSCGRSRTRLHGRAHMVCTIGTSQRDHAVTFCFVSPACAERAC